MRETPSNNKYDVIIVGSGISGQSCAKKLADTKYSVLLIDSNPKFYEKVCAGGITNKDIPLISKNYRYSDLQQARISYKNSSFTTPKGGIASFNRERFLSDGIEDLHRAKNITISIPSNLVQVTDHNSIILDGNDEIGYKYLIGADGSSSRIRNHLKLPRKNIAIGMQFCTKGSLDRPFELILDDDIAGYLWIFPHENHAKVGIGGKLNSNRPDELKRKLESFVKENSIEIQKDTFQSSTILTDYKGWEFGNIFLAGDAAGFTPALTWEGVYPAIISGTAIAEKILGKSSNSAAHVKLQKHLRKKAVLDTFALLLTNRTTRKIFFNIGMVLVKAPGMERIISKVAL